MLYLVGIIISFFLVFILWGKKDKSQADNILAVWLFFSGVHLSLFYLFITKQYLEFPFLLGIELPLPLAHGPFLFLYVKALTQSYPLKKNILLHFIPILIVIAMFSSFFILPSDKKIEIYRNEGAGYEFSLAFLYFAIILSGTGYSLFSLQKLHKHQRNISDRFSFNEKINLTWLRYLIWGSVFIWFTVVFGTDTQVYTAIVLYILFIGYFGIKQVGIFSNRQLNNNKPTTSDFYIQELSPEKAKYEKSNLTDNQMQAIHGTLCELMLAERPYSNPELTLLDLAQQVHVHPNTLSQVINSIEQRNFFDYINAHRVEAFKQAILLPENQKFTLLSIAFDCGFNSKTSFNRNFKKVTGLSPSEYLKQQDINLLQLNARTTSF
ncbi:transcriptional regulator, AraC family [Pseudopedobacter saltans DSM 12145]|uniref:Transcriptional regulator, AraC family n=2 Tax=Pseudopedobacter saltans TaxID=151895 RepID=F0SCF3_PSESL|nr:transcriptional regulator, AraC family [Pseudopedobacter saltans DSM 12145]